MLTLTARALIRACHPGPTAAVTTLVVLLAVPAGHTGPMMVLLGAAVLSGQLTIGWSNDLIDAGRDRQVGRTDKPIASGALSPHIVGIALAVAAATCVVLSLALGWRPGIVHLVLGVGAGWAYNLGLKRTVWSWVPYGLAFASLPAIIHLALDPPVLPPWWMVAAAVLMGVAAHLLNALPDLADDASTGVRGLPHRLGMAATQTSATMLLVSATVLLVVAPEDGPPPAAAWGLVVVAGLAAVAMRARGKAPFRAAVGIAAVNVVMLVVAG